jgi:hypothetical protein
MDTNIKQAFLLGCYKSWMNFTIESLRGKTALNGEQLADYLEERITEINKELNQIPNTNGNRNNSQADTQGS